MERIITIEGYDIPVKSTAGSLMSYKMNFNRDGLKDLLRLSKGIPDSQNVQNQSEEEIVDNLIDSDFDFDIFFRFLWVFAKSADPTIPPMEIWLETFEVSPIEFMVKALEVTTDLLVSTASSSIKPIKKIRPTKNQEEVTTETLIRRAVDRGINVQDLDNMTIGMVVDYLTAANNEDMKEDKPAKKYATAEDISNF